jgi:hypothetical protein
MCPLSFGVPSCETNTVHMLVALGVGVSGDTQLTCPYKLENV